MRPLISVIVPVYKVEAYLDKCVQSILDQTYENLEIILVDDGSPDNCPVMCDAWSEKDSRIKVIHKKNGGLSDARNAGMAVATGELLGFVDGDDWIEPNMYELLFRHMQEDKADIAACGVEMVWEDGTLSRMLTANDNCVLSKAEGMKAIINEDLLKQPVWYKLYKTALIKDIPFAVGKCHEDVFWSYQAVGQAERIAVFNTPCYHYVQRKGSIMGASFSVKRLDGFDAKLLRLTYITNHFPGLVYLAKRDLWFFCFYSGQAALRYMTKSNQRFVFKKLKQALPRLSLSFEENKNLLKKERFWITLGRIYLKGTCHIRNLLHIGL